MRLYEPDLESYYKLVRKKDPRLAAEVAYALATLHEGQLESAQFAADSIALFESVGIATLEDAAARCTEINGIPIPQLIHEDVVRARFHVA